eukprot:scaffold61976_cov57-Phaeocystis_antarctica.AAC.1
MISKHGQWPAPCRGAPRALRCRCRSEQMCTVPSARDEIQLSQSATQARQTVRVVGTVCG